MPKFFVASDIHGFYDEYMKALNEAGYDKENPDHYLIVCGDYFDRGTQNDKVFQFLNLSPRTFLIKGNHESLFVECCNRGYPHTHDYSNGTVDSIIQLGDPTRGNGEISKDFPECCNYALNRVQLFFDRMLNFFETEKYIFVHGYIPVITDDNMPPWYVRNRSYSFDHYWREAKYLNWEDSRWINGINMAMKNKFLVEGKTIVFGHWHCSYAHSLAENKPEFGEGADFSPFYGEGFIAIDACTAYSKKVNVIVLEDNLLPNYKEKLKYWKAMF